MFLHKTYLLMVVLTLFKLDCLDAASSLTPGVSQTFIGKDFSISLFEQKERVSGVGSNDNVDAVISMGKGEVLDYRFVSSIPKVTFALDNYLVGSAGRVKEYKLTDKKVNNLKGSLNIWKENDPDADSSDYPNAQILNSLNGADVLSGSIDISGISAGTVYILYGGYQKRVNDFDFEMIDTDRRASSISLDDVSVDWKLETTELALSSVDFANMDGYEEIVFNMDAASGKFIGLILTRKKDTIPECNTMLLLGFCICLFFHQRSRNF